MPVYFCCCFIFVFVLFCIFQAFAIFCGMAIQNTVMYENVNKAMAKQTVALEVRGTSF